MQVTYHLNEEELGPAFLNSLKAAFRGKTLKISVEAEPNSSLTTQSTEQKVINGVAADHAYRLSYDEIAQLAEALEANESVDPVTLFIAHRVSR